MANTPPGASQAPNTAANGFNPTNSDPRLIMVDDAMSLTRANITGWNKSDIESTMFKEVGLDRVIAQTKEARMAGTKQRTLTDLLLSRHTPLKVGGGVNTQSVIQPFRLVPRRNRVNPGYFRVSAGAKLSNFTGQGGAGGGNTKTFTGLQNGAFNVTYDGTAGGTAIDAAWVLTVNNGSLDADSSPFAKSPNNVLKNPEKYFLPRHSITAEWVDANGNKQTAQLRIVDAAAGPTSDQAYVLVVPNRTFKGDQALPGGSAQQPTGIFGSTGAATNGWWEGNAALQVTYQPATGLVTIGANAVSDYQQYGAALPGYNEYGLIEYWRQTHRWVHKYNDEYVKALEAATTSDGLKKFRLLPLAKLRAQQEKFNEDFFYNSCFYGDVENDNQTIAKWNYLPTVIDPAWAASGESGTLAMEYISRTLGMRTQIAASGNVYDAQAGPLDLDALFQAGYFVKREREGESGAEVTDIDIMTDRLFTRPLIRQMMTRYYKAKYGLDNVTMFMESGKQITFNGAVMFEYDSYELPDYGYTLHVFCDQYFDDKVAQFQNGQKSAGRAVWMIDWSDIAVGVIKNMSVPRTNNLADNVYKYVMAQNVQHVLLNSRTFEVAVGNTNRHRIIENYSDACPKLTVPGCDISANK